MLLYILVAPDTLNHSTKFQLFIPSQSQVILTHVNNTDLPLAGLKCTQKFPHFGYHKYTPLQTCLLNIA